MYTIFLSNAMQMLFVHDNPQHTIRGSVYFYLVLHVDLASDISLR